jgi:DNA polymerase III sliding clamp (beta) subunit (PCNA family)
MSKKIFSGSKTSRPLKCTKDTFVANSKKIHGSKYDYSKIDLFKTKANKIHNNKYDYSKVDYINRNTKVIIICKSHGEFKQKPFSHIKDKQGCPKCGKKQSANKLRLTLDNFIKKSKKMHGNYYDYSKVIYKRNNDPVKIICPKHGIFNQKSI